MRLLSPNHDNSVSPGRTADSSGAGTPADRVPHHVTQVERFHQELGLDTAAGQTGRPRPRRTQSLHSQSLLLGGWKAGVLSIVQKQERSKASLGGNDHSASKLGQSQPGDLALEG